MRTADETKAMIRAGLLTLLRDEDVDDIVVKDLVGAVGISRSTFYLYYDSVYSVLQEIEDDFFAGMARIADMYAENHYDDRYFFVPSALTIDVMRFARENSDMFLSLLGRHGEQQFQHKLDQLLYRDLGRRAIDEGYIEVSPDEEDAVCTFIANGHKALLLYLSAHPDGIDESSFAVLTYRLLFGSFRNWREER